MPSVTAAPQRHIGVGRLQTVAKFVPRSVTATLLFWEFTASDEATHVCAPRAYDGNSTKGVRVFVDVVRRVLIEAIRSI
jgi:hypothetical protein